MKSAILSVIVSCALSVVSAEDFNQDQTDPGQSAAEEELTRQITETKIQAVEEYDAQLEILKNTRSLADIHYDDIVAQEAEAQGVSHALILAIILKESSFNPHAYSKYNCIGLMQIGPDTARFMGWRGGKKNKNKDGLSGSLYNPAVNIHYGVKYLRFLLDRYARSETYINLTPEDLTRPEIRRAIGGYNAGHGNADKYKNDAPPYTHTYVKMVTRFFNINYYPLTSPNANEGESFNNSSVYPDVEPPVGKVDNGKADQPLW